MKKLLFLACFGGVLSACHAPAPVSHSDHFAPVNAPPAMRTQGNVMGISNESGAPQVYGSVGIDGKYQH